MPTLLRKRTVMFPKLRDAKTGKTVVIKRPTGISDGNLRAVGKSARALGRAFRKALY